MEITLMQGIGLALMAIVVGVDFWLEALFIFRPIIVSTLTGLIIGDVAVSLNWASTEVLFYAAITLLTSLSLPCIEFSDGLRLFRIFLIIATGLLGLPGFILATILILISIATTPTFAGVSYLWPLIPLNWGALKTLLFRYPTTRA